MARIILVEDEHSSERNATRRRIGQLNSLLAKRGHDVGILRESYARLEDNYTPHYLLTRLNRAQTSAEAFEIIDGFLAGVHETEARLKRYADAHPGAHVFLMHAMPAPRPPNKLPPYAGLIDKSIYADPTLLKKHTNILASNFSSLILLPTFKEKRRVLATVEIAAPYEEWDEYGGGYLGVPRAKKRQLSERSDTRQDRAHEWLREWQKAHAGKPTGPWHCGFPITFSGARNGRASSPALGTTSQSTRRRWRTRFTNW